MVMITAGAIKLFKLRNNIFSCWLLDETAWVYSFPREATAREIFIFINLSVCVYEVRITMMHHVRTRIQWDNPWEALSTEPDTWCVSRKGQLPSPPSSRVSLSFMTCPPLCHSETVAWEDFSKSAPNERQDRSLSLFNVNNQLKPLFPFHENNLTSGK